MASIGNPGRFAGFLYVLTSIAGFFALGYVPGKLIVHAAATASNIAALEALFRIGIASQLVSRVWAQINYGTGKEVSAETVQDAKAPLEMRRYNDSYLDLPVGKGVCALAKPSLVFTYYIAAPIEKVWDGFVSKEANQQIFAGAEFEVELKPGGSMTWSGPGKDGKPTRYVTGGC
jgi:hypothetical protein